MKWLITGGCGFIGRNLVKKLVDDGGHYIRVVDSLVVGTRKDLASVASFSEINKEDLMRCRSELEIVKIQPQGKEAPSKHLSSKSTTVQLLNGDILDDKLMIKASQNMDVIVHLAANTGVAPSVKNPRLDMETNVIGTFNMLEAARQNHVKRFIFASSGAPVGECDPPIHEEVAPHPVSPYGASKLAGEGYCSAYFRAFGVETIVLRFGNVYGPLSGKKSSVVAKFIKYAIEKRPVEIYGDGTQTRDFIFVEDLIHALMLCVSGKGVAGEIFQIATNTETTIRDLVNKLIPVLNESGIRDFEVHHGSWRVGDVRRNFSDTSKAKRLLGWQSEFELTEGLKRTVRWFLSQ